MVSVIMVTYKHEAFIAEAINGVLMQECDFDVELIIADDCSPDNTDTVVESFRTHPNFHWIKYTKHEINKGANNNFIWSVAQSTGKYIAMCEGDDYWTDPLKLQKQLDILETNSSLVGCFHNSEERYWNDYSKASNLFLSFSGGREVSISEITGYNMVPTASIVFKTPVPREIFTEEFKILPMGDWPIHLLNTRKGNYYYIPQIMSVRNLHPSSVWSSKPQNENVKKMLDAYKILLKSDWFENEVLELLKIGAKNLQNQFKPRKYSKRSTLKKRVINKLIRILNKI
jgi:glycosyltransferase involved in cell wall biosynthesis